MADGLFATAIAAPETLWYKVYVLHRRVAFPLVCVLVVVTSLFVFTATAQLAPARCSADATGRSLFPVFDMIDNLADVENGHGIVATVRRTRAALLSVDSAIPYYVFVHRIGTQDGDCNLAFQYSTTDSGWGDSPRVNWIGAGSLRITVAYRRDITKIVEQRQQVGAIEVSYVFARRRPSGRAHSL